VSVAYGLVPTSIPSPPLSWADIKIPISALHAVQEWLHSFISWWPITNYLDIKTYALCLVTGIILATIWAAIRLTRRGGEPGVAVDFALGAVIGGVIGARIWHVLTHYNDYFGPGKDLWNVFAIWEGGIAIFGSIVGGMIGILIVSRITGLRFWSFADALIPGMLLAQAVGRFGNYFNHELYGQPTTLPWGLQIEASNAAYPVGLPAHTLFHPTFLYEMLWNLLGIAIILLIERQYRLRWGKTAGLYFIWYGIGRVWFESIRIDPSDIIFGLRSNVWGAIFAIVFGIAILIVQTRRHRGIEPSVYVPGRQWAPSSALDSEETYSDSDDDGEGAARTPETAATSGAGV
jgi:prolipoprotein diacylglyceryl transferase